jgi:hypothetical protein
LKTTFLIKPPTRSFHLILLVCRTTISFHSRYDSFYLKNFLIFFFWTLHRAIDHQSTHCVLGLGFGQQQQQQPQSSRDGTTYQPPPLHTRKQDSQAKLKVIAQRSPARAPPTNQGDNSNIDDDDEISAGKTERPSVAFDDDDDSNDNGDDNAEGDEGVGGPKPRGTEIVTPM